MKFYTDKYYKFTAIRNWNDVSYLIDSCFTFDHGLELMVFKCNKYFPEDINKVIGARHIPDDEKTISYNLSEIQWKPALVTHRYSTVKEAEEDFDKIVNDWENFVKSELFW